MRFSRFLIVIFASTYCISLLGQLPRSSNLIGSYSFTGNANDSSGNNYHGTFTGNPTLTSDRNGVSNSAYTFDGNDYIYTSDAMANEFTNVFTISAWIKSTNNATVDIFGLGQQECNSNAGPVIRLGSNINFNRCNEGFDTPNSNYYYDGIWHHYAFTYSGSQRKVYRDGTLVNTSTKSNIFNINTYGLAIGRAQMDLSGNFFVGSMDEVNVWNIALTDAEVSSVYNYSENNTTANPNIERSQITLDNSTVSVTFSDAVYGGSANATSTLEVSDFSLIMSGGSASLSSATPSSINVSGTTIGLGIPLTGTPDGSEILTISPVNNSIFSVSGDTVSSTQSSNTVQLISNIVSSGLILYLDATNQNSYSGSGTNWYDLTENQNNGSILNGTLYDSQDNSFSFDGTDDKIITPSISNIYSYTIEITAKGGDGTLIYRNSNMNYSDNSDNLNLKISNSNNNVEFRIEYDATDNDKNVVVNNNFSQNKFYHIAVSYDWNSKTQKVYIDGILKGTAQHSSEPSNIYRADSFYSIGTVGYSNHGGGNSDRDMFNGKISKLVLYDHALSDQQVLQNYDALNDIPPTDISLTSNTISETASLGSFIGTLSATDSDTSINNLSFSFESSGDTKDDDNGSFTISGTSLLVSTTLDYETKTSYNVYVKVSDGTNDFAKAFTISVTNINEAPTDLGFGLNVIENGLIMYLDATNPDSRGTNQWNDLSGNGNHATVNGATLVSDSYYSLDGDDWFNWTTDVLTTDGPYTMQGFIKTTNTNWNGSNAFYNTYRSDKGIWWHFNTNGTLGWRHYGNGGTNGNLSGFNFVQNQWQMVTLTYDGSNLKLYIDKNYKSSANAGSYYAGPQNANSGATMGRLHSRNGDYSFHGQIRNKLIYNRALTQQEIENNFDLLNGSSGSGSGTTTSTASFDEGSAVGTVVATLTATDTDTTNLTYSLATGNGTTDQDNSLFTVSGTHLLVASSTISYDTTTSLNVNLQVSDGEYTISKAFQITVNDVNRAPTDIGLTSNTITENASPSTVIGTLSSIDSDTTDTTSFTLATSGDAQDDDNGSFTISGTSLILNSSPDYETKASYNIYINVNDGANNYAKAFTVSVTNVLEPITNLGFEVASIVTDGLILHLDAGDSNSYSGAGNTWNDISGNSNHFDINNVATHNNEGYFLFNNTLVGGTGMIGPPSNSFGLSQTNHTIELVMMPTEARGSIINFRGDSHDYGINVHVPWSNNNIYYDVGGCCGTSDRINLERNIVGQKIHIIFRSRPSTNPKREVILNGTSILNSGVNNTSTNNFTNIPVTLGGFMYNNNSSDHSVSARLYSVKVYNRALTDTEVAINFTSSTTITGGTSTSTISIDEEVSIGTLVAKLTATDSDTTNFSFSLISGNGTNDQHNSLFTISGTQLLVAGNIDYETNSTLNLYVQASDGTNTFARALTVNVNDINEPPVITTTTLAQDNSSIDVTFSEAVYSTNGGSGALEVSDFALSISGGTATLSSTTPSSISVNGNTYTLGLPLFGISDGTEVLTVRPASNAIYDLGSAVASTTQSSNTVTLNPPNAAPSDILLSSSSVNENVSIGTLVATLSTTDSDSSDTHTYSLVSGAGDTDNTSFSINGVNLLTAAAVDYESQNSFSILLQTSDGTATYTESFTISVIDGEDDSDGDGFFDNSDAFPSDPSEWSDNDGDGIGDNADTDDDNDGWSDTIETSCGTNPLSSSDTPSDFDQDGNPDCLDPDDDNDTYPDLEDAFPFNAEEWADNDEDGTGDNADTDDDNDGYLDADEIQCESDPLDSSSLPLDFDVDGAPDCIDDNDDNDYCLDIEDDFPLNRDLCVDTDGDGIDNRYEFDSDNDGVADTRDAFPLDPNESQDTDGDGIGDNEDQDDNNDGFSDEAPIVSKVITPNQPGVESTWKIINIEDYPFTTVKVYAPDGSIVFESTNYQNQWRGNNMRTGSPLPTGPYYFRISYGSILEKFEDGWLYIFN